MDSIQQAKALFIYKDSIQRNLCSDCPHAQHGQIRLAPIDESDSNYSVDKGLHGDLSPLCSQSQLAHLGHWQGHQGALFPENLLPLRLFKCRQGHWLVVQGLLDANPTEIFPDSMLKMPK